MRRTALPEGGVRCGWCQTGNHRPTDASFGCTRYRPQIPQRCACTHPEHEKDPQK